MTVHLVFTLAVTATVVILALWVYFLRERVLELERDACDFWVDIQACQADVEAIRRTVRSGPLHNLN